MPSRKQDKGLTEQNIISQGAHQRKRGGVKSKRTRWRLRFQLVPPDCRLLFWEGTLRTHVYGSVLDLVGPSKRPPPAQHHFVSLFPLFRCVSPCVGAHLFFYIRHFWNVCIF